MREMVPKPFVSFRVETTALKKRPQAHAENVQPAFEDHP
jgi:hypothetical protein